MSNLILEEAKQLQNQLISWRRELHQIPEIDVKLPQTVKYVSEQLTKMGIEYRVMEDCSCIVAQIGSGKKCFLLRSDMDALPMTEESRLEFASINGCTHACGHDMHATILLGAAKLLKEHESELNGVVKLLFQSGEETFNGAKAALAGHVLENPHVNAAIAVHVSACSPVGLICFGNQVMSSVYGFKFTLTGQGGHGAQPQSCIDPINAGVAVYEALQSLIARECPPSAEAILTIGQFTAGEVANIIPQKCVLQGTLRTFDKKVRELLIQRINEIVPAVASAYRTSCVIEELSNVPCLTCDASLTEEIINSAKSLDGELQFKNGIHGPGSEDFAVIADEVPACYFFMGASTGNPADCQQMHNPKVIFNEDALQFGVAIYTKAAMDWLATHGNE